MRKSLAVVALALALTFPAAALAQTGFGIGVKAGSIGVGVEGAVSLGSMLNLRGGGALFPVDWEFTHDTQAGDLEFDLNLPDSYLNLGLDLYPGGGGFRISGGLLFKPDDPSIEATPTGTVEFGGETFNREEVGTITGEIDSGSVAPFAAIGFGNHTRSGFGFFVDLGAALLKEPELTLRAEGGTRSQDVNQRLEQERQEIEDELDKYLKIYPIVQIGVRIGLGG